MLQLDAVQLYDLSEAGRLLFRDPLRLRREARRLEIPSACAEQQLGLPAPWVEAESGASPADPEALKIYWLARLAPPSPDARRPLRARTRLPAETLLDAEEAAQRIFATPDALRRMDVEGVLPSLRVDGAVRYDAELTDLVARDDEGAEVRSAADARRGEILAWARFEYETAVEEKPPVQEDSTPDFDAVRTPAPEANTEVHASEDAPAAYEIPTDLLGEIDTLPPSRLIDVDGFDTIDED